MYAFRIPLSQLLLAMMLSAAIVVVTPSTADAALKSACSGDVCEQVTYSGGKVTEWKASVYPGGGYNCRTAVYVRNGGVTASRRVCGSGTLVAYAPTPFNVGSGSTLCAYFVDESGYPCVKI